MDDKTTTLSSSPTPPPQPGAPAAPVPTGGEPTPLCLPGPGPGSGHSVIGTPSAAPSQAYPAASSTLSVTPANRSQPDAPARKDEIKCSNCKLVLPKSSFAYKKCMGTVEQCKQCDGCRTKKRAAEKARKDKKKQEQAQEGAQQQQKQRQGEQERPEPNQAEDAKRRQEEELQKYRFKMQDGQRRQQEQIRQQHQQLERQIPEEKSEVNGSLQENHSPSAGRSVPNAEGAFTFPCMDLLQQVSSNSAAFAMPSAAAAVNPTSSSTNLDFMDLDDDMAYYNNQPTELSMQTPSAALPKPEFTVQPEVLVRTRSLADLNVTPIPNPMPGQVPQDSKLTSEHFELTQTVALRKPLQRDEVQMRIDFERNKFLTACQTCSYLRHRSHEEVQHIWRKREAAIIMDLVVVPLPEPQPIFGLSYNAGSHRNIKDAYSYAALDF